MERPLDADLDDLDRAELVAEIRRLREAIRDHRDSSGHDLCWWHPDLWSVLPEGTDAVPTVPDWPQFMRGCVAYRTSLDDQAPRAPRSAAPYGETPDGSGP